MEERDREELFSKRIRAGKRTYFFDVKSTRSLDYYITITESRRHQKEDGFVYEKHKMFLYKEDFDRFREIMNDMMDYIVDKKGEEVISERHNPDFKKDYFEENETELIAENSISANEKNNTNSILMI